MPTLPSGRRVEFSIDRFRAMLSRMPVLEARQTVAALREPNDLLYVMDVVDFTPDGQPYFANRIAADFASYAIDWSHEDQEALAAWIESASATFHRAEAIAGLRGMVAEVADRAESLLQAA